MHGSVDGRVHDRSVYVAYELQSARAYDRRDARSSLGIVGEPVEDLAGPPNLGRVRMGDFDFWNATGPGQEVQRAPVAQTRNRSGGHVTHQLAMIDGGHDGAVQTGQEFETLALESLAFGRTLSLAGPTGCFELEELARGDVLRVSDSAEDRAVVVECDGPATVEPVDAAVRPYDTMFHDVVSLVRNHLIDGGQRAIHVIRMQPGHPRLERPFESFRCEPEQPSQRGVPHRHSGVHVPFPGAQLRGGQHPPRTTTQRPFQGAVAAGRGVRSGSLREVDIHGNSRPSEQLGRTTTTLSAGRSTDRSLPHDYHTSLSAEERLRIPRPEGQRISSPPRMGIDRGMVARIAQMDTRCRGCRSDDSVLDGSTPISCRSGSGRLRQAVPAR